MDSFCVTEFTLNIKCGNSSISQIQIESSKSVKDLRELTAEKYNSSSVLTVIIHKGRILTDDNKTIAESGINNKDSIFVWIKSQNKNTTNPSVTPTQPVSSQTVENSPFNIGQIGGLQGLQNMGLGSQNLAEVQQRMTREIMNNPESLKNLMDSPLVRNMMRNPESFQSVLQSNPQFREIMDANPEMAHIFNNPELIRESMEYLNNPNMLLEMMRNHDRSMANIENLPGGMSALQRMYRDVEEPMRQAVAEMGNRESSNDVPPPADTPGQSINEPIPNIWSSGTSQPPRSNPPQSSGDAGLGSYVNQIMANPEFMRNMVQSPVMSSMLESISTNPEAIRMMVDTMPAAANNPQLREQLIANMPIMIRQMRNNNVQQLIGNPKAMAALLKIQQGMEELHAEAPEFLQSLSGVIPPQSSTQSSQPDSSSIFNLLNRQSDENRNLPPRERYASQLQQLASMGFVDTDLNLTVLERVAGDLNRAIDILLGQIR